MIFLGIDCGTQSTKTIALDWENGQVLASAQEAYGFVPGLPSGSMEQEPADWTRAAENTIAEVLRSLGGRKAEVRGIGVSGQQHGLVPLDKDGQVVRPAKLWCDTSTTPQCREITEHFGGVAEIIRRTGNAMLPGYTAPKILWLRQNEPENWEKTSLVLLPHDYLNYWLTGKASMEPGDASGMALLDISRREWAADVVNFVAPDLAEKLPPLRPSSEAAGDLRPELAARWGLSEGICVSAGGGDNMMGAIGTGNIRPGVVTASLGTSGTLYAYSETPIIDPKGEVAGFCDSTGAWLPLVCTMNLTIVTEHVRKLFGWGVAEFDRQVESAPVGAGGLLFLPYLTGERTPNLPDGTGVLHGLSTANLTPAHLARAATEGATLGLAYGLGRFRELGVHPTEIRLTGGGSNSRVWRQICADIFGVPVVCLRSGEGAGLGAALQAGWTWENTQGQVVPMESVCARLVEVDETSRVAPIAENVQAYKPILAKMDTLRDHLHGASFL